MNKKGFTLVELIVAFSLTSIIIVILFKLLIGLKEIQEFNDIKTQLLNKQAIINNEISTKLYNSTLNKVENCDNNLEKCLNLKFNDTDSLKLEAKVNDDYLKINDEKINLIEGSKITSIDFSKTGLYDVSKKNILTIKVNITHEYFDDKDFGIYIVYACSEDVDLSGVLLNFK